MSESFEFHRKDLSHKDNEAERRTNERIQASVRHQNVVGRDISELVLHFDDVESRIEFHLVQQNRLLFND